MFALHAPVIAFGTTADPLPPAGGDCKADGGGVAGEKEDVKIKADHAPGRERKKKCEVPTDKDTRKIAASASAAAPDYRLFQDSNLSFPDNDECDVAPPKLNFNEATKCQRKSGKIEEYDHRTTEKEEAKTRNSSPSSSGRNEPKGGEGVVKLMCTPKVPTDLPPPHFLSLKSVKLKNSPKISSDFPLAAASSRGKVRQRSSSRPARGSGGNLTFPATKKRGAVEEIPYSNLGADATEDNGPRSKRARFPSLTAVEATNNEHAGLAIRAIRSIRNRTPVTATKNVKEVSSEMEPVLKKAPMMTVKKVHAKEVPTKEAPAKKAVAVVPRPLLSSSSSDADSDASPATMQTKKNTISSNTKRTVIKRGKKVKIKKPMSMKRELSPAQAEYLKKRRLETWNAGVALLVEYKNLTNTCSVANAPKGSVSPKLRNFIGEARKQYKYYQQGKESTMTPARIEELKDLGFDFMPLESEEGNELRSLRFDEKWNDMFVQLEAYKAMFGTCLISSMAGTDYQSLGNWVRGQRKLINKMGREGFPPHRLAKLESIGFDFDPTKSGTLQSAKTKNSLPRVNANWEKYYKEFISFKKKHGHIIVGPKSQGGSRLYDWIHVQRKEYKRYQANEKTIMKPEWIKKLDALGFDWAPMSGDGFGKMLQERQKDHYEKLWQDRFKELLDFKKKHGHCHPSRERGVKDSLAGWVHVQRKHKRRHDKGEQVPINDDRIKLLTKVGFDWDPGRGTMPRREWKESNWEAVFHKLVSYKKQKGHCNPKKKDPMLGQWACRQRSLYKKNKQGQKTALSDERIAMLTSIGFVFK